MLEQIVNQLVMQSQAQQGQIAQLAAQLAALQQPQAERSGPFDVRWPLQELAGQKLYPGKRPFPYIGVVAMTPDVANEEFGETTSEATGTYEVDKNDPSFLLGVGAAMYQNHTDGEVDNGILHRWRPVASTWLPVPGTLAGPDVRAVSLCDFEWAVKMGSNEIMLQKDWAPSTLLHDSRGHGHYLSAEKEISRYESITCKARPLAALGAGNGFILKFLLFLYKMVEQSF